MDTLAARFESADRLSLVCERIGYALWQLQELESSTAQFFVLVTKAEPRMGKDAGYKLIEAAQRRTLGQTIHAMVKAGVIGTDLEAEFKHLLSERNWLVHSSRAGSRGAVHSDIRLNETISRVNMIADQALAVLKQIGSLVESYVVCHGVTKEIIDRESARILSEWRDANAT